MLDSKLFLTNDLKNFIKSTREEHKLKLIDIEEKSKYKYKISWLSQIEGKRTKTITRENILDIFKIILDIPEIEAEKYIEDFLYKTFNFELFKYELFKQIHNSSITIHDLEKKLNYSTGTIQKFLDTKIEANDETTYITLKAIFTFLDYINPKAMDTFISMFGVKVPKDSKIYSFDDINKCYKLETNFPCNDEFHNWGEYLDFLEWEIQNSYEQLQNQADEIDFQLNQIEKENSLRNQHPKIRKEELQSKLDKSYSKLQSIIDTIDVNNYRKTIGNEKYLETLFELLLSSDGTRIFKFLFQYPLHKIDPKDLKEICEFIDNKLDHEYHIHIKEDSDKPAECIDDLIEDYSRLECRFKPQIWADIDESDDMIDFTSED